MLDLQGKVSLQSNVATLAKDIEKTLNSIKGTIHFSTSDIQKEAAAYKKLATNISNTQVVLAKANAQLLKHNNLTKAATTVQKQQMTVVQQFGDQAAIAAKRYTAFTIAVGLGYGALRATQGAIKESIVFQDKLVKMTQISGKSISSLKPLSQEITKLSTSLGVSSDKLADVSLTLLQAGYSSRDAKKALEALAKVELAPSFGDIKNATEAAIAILSQFGGTVDDLESHLSSINKVSADFAVEAEDIVVAIQRAGAAFGQLSKDTNNPKQALNEFIALFTSVRSTTRESAETIATGLRTIFTRLQRPSTIQFFKELGVELQDSKGLFIGLYPAIERISNAIKGLNFRDPRMAQISEELGGFRQINKTIPLLTQLGVAQDALNSAQSAGNNLTEVNAMAQASLAVQIKKVHEQFLALFRDIQETATFKLLANSMLEVARAAVIIATALKPVIPLLAVFTAGKILKAQGPFIGAFTHRLMTGNPIVGKAGGGFVPGTGSGDTVPGMLTPGEFVIKKSSAQKIGLPTLHAMNKYGSGGPVRYFTGGAGGVLGSLGGIGERSNQSIGIEKNIIHATVVFDQALENLSGKAKEVADSFRIVRDESVKTGHGQARLTARQVAFRTGATEGTVSHEAGHVLQRAIAESHGLTGIAGVQGSYASQIAKEFKSQRYQELSKAGVGRRKIAYHMKPSELLAEAFGRMTPEQQKIATFRMQNDPVLAAANPMSVLGTKSLGVTNIIPGATGSVHSMHMGIQPTSAVNLNPGGRNWRSRALRAFNGNIPGTPKLGIGAGVGKAFNWAKSSENATMTLAIGAGLAQGQFGSAATNEKGQRGKGVIGDVLGGTLGGAAAGNALMPGYGTAAGAVIGFTTALISSTDTLRKLDFNDALEAGLEKAKTGGTPNFIDIQQQMEAATTLKGREYSPEQHKSQSEQVVLRDFRIEHQNDMKELVKAKFAPIKGKYGSFNQLRKSGAGDVKEALGYAYENLPGMSIKDIKSFVKKSLGLSDTENIAAIKEQINDIIVRFGDLADAMKSANVATAGITARMDMFHTGFGTIADRSELIRNPSKATMGETLKELNAGGMGELGFSAFVQGNIRDIAKQTFEGRTLNDNGEGGQTAGLRAALDAAQKQYLRMGGSKKNLGEHRHNIGVMLEESLGVDAKAGETLSEFTKKFENPMGGILGHAADIRHEMTSRQREFLEENKGLNQRQIGVFGQHYQGGALGVEAFNKSLEFQGIHAGSRSTMGNFNTLQENLGAAAGEGFANSRPVPWKINGQKRNLMLPGDIFNPNDIGRRMRRIQGERSRAMEEGNVGRVDALNKEFSMLSAAMDNLTKATEQNTSIEKQLAELNANKEQRTDLAKQFLTSNSAGKAEIIRGLHTANLMQNNAIPGGFGNIDPENAKLGFDMVSRIGHIVPGIEKRVDDLARMATGTELPQNLFNLRGNLQQDVLNNIGVAGAAVNEQANLAQGNINAESDLARVRYEAALAPLFDDFVAKFEKAARLIPPKIDLQGNHVVQVNINGAEAFAKIQDGISQLIISKVNVGIQQLAGALKDSPPNGPGLPNLRTPQVG